MTAIDICHQCGGHSPRFEGATHEYFGASPSCWKVFGDILAKEFANPEYMKVHRLTVDTYAVNGRNFKSQICKIQKYQPPLLGAPFW